MKKFVGYFRETRTIPGSEYSTGDKTYQHIGDLIVNLIEILPVNSNSFDQSYSEKNFPLFRNTKIM